MSLSDAADDTPGAGDRIDFGEVLELLNRGSECVSVCHKLPGEERLCVERCEPGDAPGLVGHLLPTPRGQRSDIYFGLNPVAEVKWGRGKATDVIRLVGLMLDLDVKEGAFADLTEAWAFIDAMSELIGTRPVVVIFSGHGLHPVWAISGGELGGDSFYTFERPKKAKLARATRLSRRFHRWAAGVARDRFEAKLDNVSSLDHLVRVPDTTNRKDPERPVPTYAVAGGGEPLTMDRVEEFLDSQLVVTLDSDRPIDGEVLSAPEGWCFGTVDCLYVQQMVIPWDQESDRPHNGRHPWAMDRAVRLACAHRLACLTGNGLRAALEHLEKALAHWCQMVGEPRDLHPGEIEDAYRWAKDYVATFDDERTRKELGDHRHDINVGAEFRKAKSGNDSQADGQRGEDHYPPRDQEDNTMAGSTDNTEHRVDHHRGQVRMALRLAASHADRLLHVYGIGWHHFDGTRWAFDDCGHAKRAVLAMFKEALACSVDDGDKTLRADVAKCESATGIAGVLDVAAALPELAATVRDLDADPYLLNVANGTLDLRTLELRPHSPADRMTKICRGSYRPDMRSELWTAFLDHILPDAEVRGFVARFVGLGLLGTVREHVLGIGKGVGANGKSVLDGAIRNALGDYAITAEPDLFMHREGAHPTGEMDLRGVRWVAVSESERDRRLAEATVKRLTGGDTIRARRMRKDFVEFDPSHTALLITNHLPKVSGDDGAVW
jgi:hypothetical protein